MTLSTVAAASRITGVAWTAATRTVANSIMARTLPLRRAQAGRQPNDPWSLDPADIVPTMSARTDSDISAVDVPWWKSSVVYQIYPRSFCDSNGDGIGDLQGIISKQPDLNWENPQVRGEVFDLMHFWLRKGVDGFRMDVINMISKTPGWPQAPVVKPGPWQPCWQFIVNGPRLLEFLGEMRREVLSQYDIITVGEAPGVSPGLGSALTEAATGPLNMVFQFEHMDVDRGPSKWDLRQFDLVRFKQIMSRWQDGLADRGWNSLYLSNHDQPRPVSRFGDDGEFRVCSAQMFATMLHFLQGTPYVYQGEELGMTNVHFADIDSYRDLETLNMYHEAVSVLRQSAESVMTSIYAKGRDNARTPMQWTSAPNVGFTTGTPWIAANPNFRTVNAAQALDDHESVFSYYRRLIALRRAHPIIVRGRYQLLLADHPHVYAYRRSLDSQRLLVLCNFSAVPQTVTVGHSDGRVLLSNCSLRGDVTIDGRRLAPYEALVCWV